MKGYRIFNSTLGNIGDCSFVDYELCDKAYGVSPDDPELAEMASEVEALDQEYAVIKAEFDRRARELRNRATARMKELVKTR